MSKVGLALKEASWKLEIPPLAKNYGRAKESNSLIRFISLLLIKDKALTNR